jgi:hypothetical protein
MFQELHELLQLQSLSFLRELTYPLNLTRMTHLQLFPYIAVPIYITEILCKSILRVISYSSQGSLVKYSHCVTLQI